MTNRFEGASVATAEGAFFAGRVAVARFNLDEQLERHPSPTVGSLAVDIYAVAKRDLQYAGALVSATLHGIHLDRL